MASTEDEILSWMKATLNEIVWVEPTEVSVKGPSDFMEYFAGDTIRHFQVPGHLGSAYAHHFLAKSKYYEQEKECMVQMIHYTPPEGNTDGAQGDCCGKTREWKTKVDNKEPVTELKSIVTKDRFRFKVQKDEATYMEGNTAECEVYFDLLKEGKWTKVSYDEMYPKTENESDKAWEVAEDRIGESKYNAFTHNCEHFATQIMACLYKGFSKQVSDVIKAAAASSAGASAVSSASAYLIKKAFSSDKEDK